MVLFCISRLTETLTEQLIVIFQLMCEKLLKTILLIYNPATWLPLTTLDVRQNELQALSLPEHQSLDNRKSLERYGALSSPRTRKKSAEMLKLSTFRSKAPRKVKLRKRNWRKKIRI
jgi:hypothetical protein